VQQLTTPQKCILLPLPNINNKVHNKVQRIQKGKWGETGVRTWRSKNILAHQIHQSPIRLAALHTHPSSKRNSAILTLEMPFQIN
jgi:uncharacterized protein YjdB